MYIGTGYTHTIDFIDWLVLVEGVFFALSFLSFARSFLYTTCILFCAFGISKH